MYEQLQAILADFRYAEALDWFTKHVEGKYFLKELLSQGEDPYNKKKLIEELREIESSFAKPIPAPPSPTAPATITSAPVLVASAPPTLDLALLDQEWKPKYKEANHWFERLEFLPTAQERKEAAFRILELMDEVEETWAKKDFIQQHGAAPDFEDHGIEALDTVQMIQRINTLRTYISKANKGKLSKEKIPAWEAEKAELERRVSR